MRIFRRECPNQKMVIKQHIFVSCKFPFSMELDMLSTLTFVMVALMFIPFAKDKASDVVDFVKSKF